jgi:hypothetical protein
MLERLRSCGTHVAVRRTRNDDAPAREEVRGSTPRDTGGEIEMVTEVRSTTFNESRLGRAARLGLIATALLALTRPAAAQLLSTQTTSCVQPVDTRLIEWDVTPLGDSVVGALAVDDRSSSRQSKLWFVTRVSGSPSTEDGLQDGPEDPNTQPTTRVYRLTPGRGIKRDPATARSWALGAGITGGLRLRHSDDGRFVFVNTQQEDAAPGDGLVAVDTRDNTRVTWFDRPHQFFISDVSTDTRGSGHSVFTAAPVFRDDMGNVDGGDGVVQRLRPRQPELRDGKWIVRADVTRWLVGAGAGECDNTGSLSSPCIAGVVVDRRRGHPIYFSAPRFVNNNGSTVSAVGELDPTPVKCNAYDLYNSCAKVRYWPLPAGTASPRQILVDDNGKVWGITGSGHLFSLDIDQSRKKAVVTRHVPVPGGVLLSPGDLFALAPDGGTIGFNDSETNEVSVLFPNAVKKDVFPETRNVERRERILKGVREDADKQDHAVDPNDAVADGLKYTNEGDGTYLETDVSTGVRDDGTLTGSASPTGTAPDGARKTGSFFYGLFFGGGLANRVGHFEVRIDPDKELEHRKDDDDFDDDGDDDDWDADDDDDGRDDAWDDDDDNDCVPDMMDNDHDNDGVENEHDSKSNREHKRTDRGSLGAGQSKSYETTADSNSLAMVAIVEAATLTTPLSIDIVDPNGVVVLSTPPALGKAVATTTPALPGVYTIRVKNGGLSSTTYKTTIISKSIWF